jgi:hypothetical protein
LRLTLLEYEPASLDLFPSRMAPVCTALRNMIRPLGPTECISIDHQELPGSSVYYKRSDHDKRSCDLNTALVHGTANTLFLRGTVWRLLSLTLRKHFPLQVAFPYPIARCCRLPPFINAKTYCLLPGSMCRCLFIFRSESVQLPRPPCPPSRHREAGVHASIRPQ